MSIRRAAAFAVCACLAATAAHCQDEPDADAVVARVLGADIRLGHVIAFAEQLSQEYRSLPDEALYNAIVDQMIRHALLASNGNDGNRRARFASENTARAIIADGVVREIAQGAVTEEAVRAAYEASYAGREPEPEFRASHILVETKDEAMSILDELRAGADFAETAKARSTGPSGPRGGDLGWFGPGTMVKPFEDAVLSLGIGELSGPVRTEFGWHVILLADKRDLPVPSIEEARGELEQRVAGAAIEEAIARLAETAGVERADQGIDPAAVRRTDLLDD